MERWRGSEMDKEDKFSAKDRTGDSSNREVAELAFLGISSGGDVSALKYPGSFWIFSVESVLGESSRGCMSYFLCSSCTTSTELFLF